MISDIETPLSFQTKKACGSHTVEVRELREICQGGPDVGKMFLNGEWLFDKVFVGGPFVIVDGQLLIPVFVRRLFARGFQFSRVDLGTNQIFPLTDVVDLVWLDEVIGNEAFFFCDMQRTKRIVCNWRKA